MRAVLVLLAGCGAAAPGPAEPSPAVDTAVTPAAPAAPRAEPTPDPALVLHGESGDPIRVTGACEPAQPAAELDLVAWNVGNVAIAAADPLVLVFTDRDAATQTGAARARRPFTVEAAVPALAAGELAHLHVGLGAAAVHELVATWWDVDVVRPAGVPDTVVQVVPVHLDRAPCGDTEMAR